MGNTVQLGEGLREARPALLRIYDFVAGTFVLVCWIVGVIVMATIMIATGGSGSLPLG